MEHPQIQKVTIEDIDTAVFNWFERTVAAHVETPNKDREKVPVIFSSGERFVTARTKKGVRDVNGVLILPLISVRRTNISRDPSMQALGTETPKLKFAKRIDGKTNNLQNLNAVRPVSNRVPMAALYEVYSIPFPDRSIMDYEIVIQSQYMTQMNVILEKVFNSLDIQNSFVAPFDNVHRHPKIGEPFEEREPISGHYVVGFLDAELHSTDNFEEFTDQERIIRWNTTVRVPASLNLDPEGEKPAVTVERTAFGLKFGGEEAHFFDDPLELELIFNGGKIRER